jgi:hypothetical protein
MIVVRKCNKMFVHSLTQFIMYKKMMLAHIFFFTLHKNSTKNTLKLKKLNKATIKLLFPFKKSFISLCFNLRLCLY